MTDKDHHLIWEAYIPSVNEDVDQLPPALIQGAMRGFADEFTDPDGPVVHILSWANIPIETAKKYGHMPEFQKLLSKLLEYAEPGKNKGEWRFNMPKNFGFDKNGKQNKWGELLHTFRNIGNQKNKIIPGPGAPGI